MKLIVNNSFLGQIDLFGTQYEDETLATGFGSYIARPMLRNAFRPELTEEEAKKAITDSMRVLFYRHCRTINKVINLFIFLLH